MSGYGDLTAVVMSIVMILDIDLSAWDLCFQLPIASSSRAVDKSYALALIPFSQPVMVVYLSTDLNCRSHFETHFLDR